MHDLRPFFEEAKQYEHDRKADAAIEEACFRYLSSLGYQLWANWEIQNETRRQIAVGWLALQWEAVGDEMRTRDWVRAFSQSRWRRWSAYMRKGAGWLKNWISTHSTSASRSSRPNEMPRPLPH